MWTILIYSGVVPGSGGDELPNCNIPGAFAVLH